MSTMPLVASTAATQLALPDGVPRYTWSLVVSFTS